MSTLESQNIDSRKSNLLSHRV